MENWLLSKKDLKRVVSEERSFYQKEFGNFFVDWFLGRPARKIAKYLSHLRYMEYYDYKNNKILYAFHYFFEIRLSYKLGFQIPPHTTGPGLKIYHYGGSIIINSKARIGKNCTLHQGVIIGATSKGNPVIGDNVTIFSGSKITGKIYIGNNCIIAPNAVVTKSANAGSILAGIPARVIKMRENF